MGEGGVCVWEAWNLSGELRMEKLEFGDQHHDSGLGGGVVAGEDSGSGVVAGELRVEELRMRSLSFRITDSKVQKVISTEDVFQLKLT